MQIIIKNNRLGLEGVTKLQDVADTTLKQLAEKYYIGDKVGIERDVIENGKSIKRLVFEPKPRKVLEAEVKRVLSITIDLPRDLWNEEQTFTWESEGVENLKDITEINIIKERMGILYDLPPYEERLDKFSESKVLFSVTLPQYEYLNNFYNYTYAYNKDKDTGAEKASKSRQGFIVPHEWIPENDDDINYILTEAKKLGSIRGVFGTALIEAKEKHGQTKAK